MEKEKKTRKKPGLTTWIFISLLLGICVGSIFHYWVPAGYVRDTIFVNGIFYVLGNGFIRLMQMLVVPLVFCSLVCGSMAMGDSKSLGKVGIKSHRILPCDHCACDHPCAGSGESDQSRNRTGYQFL